MVFLHLTEYNHESRKLKLLLQGKSIGISKLIYGYEKCINLGNIYSLEIGVTQVMLKCAESFTSKKTR